MRAGVSMSGISWSTELQRTFVALFADADEEFAVKWGRVI